MFTLPPFGLLLLFLRAMTASAALLGVGAADTGLSPLFGAIEVITHSADDAQQHQNDDNIFHYFSLIIGSFFFVPAKAYSACSLRSVR